MTTEELSTEEAAAGVKPTPAESAVDGEHTCAECGVSFERRYSLIMHTLKHEKSRGYKCSVSVSIKLRANSECLCGLTVLFLCFSSAARSSNTPPRSRPTWLDTSRRAAGGGPSPKSRPNRTWRAKRRATPAWWRLRSNGSSCATSAGRFYPRCTR